MVYATIAVCTALRKIIEDLRRIEVIAIRKQVAGGSEFHSKCIGQLSVISGAAWRIGAYCQHEATQE